MTRAGRASEAWVRASNARDVARLMARARREAQDAASEDRRPPLPSADADWAAWLAAREAAAAAQRAEDAADAAAEAADAAADAADLAVASAAAAAEVVAWEPRKETGCASTGKSSGGRAAGGES